MPKTKFEPSIISRPVYGELKPKNGKSHLLIADVEGAQAILDLAKKIIAMTGSKSRITFLSLPEDDPIQRRPDINLAKELLDDWSPVVELESGLEKTICHTKRNFRYMLDPGLL